MSSAVRCGCLVRLLIGTRGLDENVVLLAKLREVHGAAVERLGRLHLVGAEGRRELGELLDGSVDCRVGDVREPDDGGRALHRVEFDLAATVVLVRCLSATTARLATSSCVSSLGQVRQVNEARSGSALGCGLVGGVAVVVITTVAVTSGLRLGVAVFGSVVFRVTFLALDRCRRSDERLHEVLEHLSIGPKRVSARSNKLLVLEVVLDEVEQLLLGAGNCIRMAPQTQLGRSARGACRPREPRDLVELPLLLEVLDAYQVSDHHLGARLRAMHRLLRSSKRHQEVEHGLRSLELSLLALDAARHSVRLTLGIFRVVCDRHGGCSARGGSRRLATSGRLHLDRALESQQLGPSSRCQVLARIVQVKRTHRIAGGASAWYHVLDKDLGDLVRCRRPDGTGDIWELHAARERHGQLRVVGLLGVVLVNQHARSARALQLIEQQASVAAAVLELVAVGTTDRDRRRVMDAGEQLAQRLERTIDLSLVGTARVTPIDLQPNLGLLGRRVLGRLQAQGLVKLETISHARQAHDSLHVGPHRQRQLLQRAHTLKVADLRRLGCRCRLSRRTRGTTARRRRAREGRLLDDRLPAQTVIEQVEKGGAHIDRVHENDVDRHLAQLSNIAGVVRVGRQQGHDGTDGTLLAREQRQLAHEGAQLCLDVDVDGVGLGLGVAHLDATIDEIALDLLRQVVRVGVVAADAQLPRHRHVSHRVESCELRMHSANHLLDGLAVQGAPVGTRVSSDETALGIVEHVDAKARIVRCAHDCCSTRAAR